MAIEGCKLCCRCLYVLALLNPAFVCTSVLYIILSHCVGCKRACVRLLIALIMYVCNVASGNVIGVLFIYHVG